MKLFFFPALYLTMASIVTINNSTYPWDMENTEIEIASHENYVSMQSTIHNT